MMEGKIDIHNRERRYERVIKRLETDPSMPAQDRELAIKFVWDCKMGKTLSGRSKRKVGKARILKYVEGLRKISGWIGKPFNEVTQEDMEKLVCAIEDDIYRNGEKKYSEETKADFKKTLRKFYKWLGKPGMVDFISLTTQPKDVPALTREQVEEMISYTPLRIMKAAIMVLFDTGLRIEEFLNIRMKDLSMEKYDETSCYWADARISKTFARKIPMPLSTRHLQEWLAEHPEKNNLEAQLFPMTYQCIRKRIRAIGELAIRKKVHPHMLRHSSATYWAPKMNRYQLCAKYGWAFSSDMPDRYIKRKGIIFTEIAEKGDTEQSAKLERENRAMRERMESIERENEKLRKAFETVMPALLEKIDDPNFRKKLYSNTRQNLYLEPLESHPEHDKNRAYGIG